MGASGARAPRAALLCPGRGSYGAAELGSLPAPGDQQVSGELAAALDRVDRRRRERGDMGIRDIDSSPAFRQEFLEGHNAAATILACTAHDALRLDHRRLEVVAVGGNSMGWYSALFVAGALDLDGAFDLVETMGAMQRGGAVGGQLVYPEVDEGWHPDAGRRAVVQDALDRVVTAGHAVGRSIRFGGFAVLWGDDDGLAALQTALPRLQLGGRDYPLRLPGNSAFHSPLMEEASRRGRAALQGLGWSRPRWPLVDGRGAQWRPLTTDPEELLGYTLGTQVLEAFDFSSTVQVILREYAPDLLVLLGPGDSLGAAVAQVIVAEGWQGIGDRQAFVARQARDPFVLSLSRPEQAARVVAGSP